MGGDYAPKEILLGALRAYETYGHEIILVGQKPELEKFGYDLSPFEIIHANEVIQMDEHPALALKKKKDNSLSVAVKTAKSRPGLSLIHI